ncbi:MAG: GntR family transcriptional regulator [Pirellula sp.]|jgi:GntR family transcriptional regulator|nr:GntR family transcriptional regulator [Pirellula sp.]
MNSWLTISQADPRPLYTQVIDQVKRRVSTGDLPPGSELPSIRQLAADLKISVITIKRAYLELERDGVIQTRQGKGSYVAENPGLASELLERELLDQLASAASLGQLLGKSKREMIRLISNSFDQTSREES